MSYSIPLTRAGQASYENRDPNLERAVTFLVERMGIDQWKSRKKAVQDRHMAKLNLRATPDEGISIRDREDEIAWYLYLGETTIADPPAVDTDQANRVIPYLSALGRKLDATLAISNVGPRLDRLLRPVRNYDPDQMLFELLIGSSYIEEGWSVEALPESSEKTPDFEVKRGIRRFEVECKRFARRGEYTERERDAWLRLWKPASQWLVTERHSVVLTITFHAEVHSLPGDYLVNLVTSQIVRLLASQSIETDSVTIRSALVDYGAISKELTTSYVKRQSSRERYVATGRHERDYGLTLVIGGRGVCIGPPTVAGNGYWDSIDYVTGAYWRCDAPEAIEVKARDIMKRLSDATGQLTGRLGGIAHLGIEAAEGDNVELVRAAKVWSSIARFDRRGKPLEWIFIHYFTGESLPDGSWALDETCQWHGDSPAFYRPLRTNFVVAPSDATGSPVSR